MCLMNWNITVVLQVEAESKESAKVQLQDMLEDSNWFEIESLELEVAVPAFSELTDLSV